MKSPLRLPLLAGLCVLALATVAAEPAVLVYQRNGKGYVHDNLDASAAAIRELGERHGFKVDATKDPVVFADATLAKYQALIFANSNNEAFDTDDQRAAFQRFLARGGGFVGLHSSTGSEREWTEFQRVQGAKFLRHPPLQLFTIDVRDRTHPATAHLGATWAWTDECYFFSNLNPAVTVLLSANVATLKDPRRESAPGATINGLFPLAWCHEIGGARVFYTALGHKIEYYSDPVFRRHLLGGIQWVLRTAPAPRPAR